MTEPIILAEGETAEPDWPTDRPKLHLCEGCGQECAPETFAVVDAFQTGEYLPLVRCAECRSKPNPVRRRYEADRAWLEAQNHIEHSSTCNLFPGYSKDPKTWARGCDCGATSRAAEERKGGS